MAAVGRWNVLLINGKSGTMLPITACSARDPVVPGRVVRMAAPMALPVRPSATNAGPRRFNPP
jgi:hypothetical protein